MKKWVIGFIVLFTLSSLPAFSATPPKPGSICSKQGITKTYQGKKYTCIKNGKKLVWNKGVLTKVLIPIPAPTTTKISDYMQSAAIASVEECKLKDARINKLQPNNSGFPLSPDIIPPTGKIKFIAILVDFSDAPGTDEFLRKMREQENSFKNWFKVTSSDRSNVEWITVNKWFRAKRPSTAYVTDRGVANSSNPLAETWNSYAQEFIDLSGKTFDWTGVHGVFFHFSQDQKTGISGALLGRGVELMTPQGNKNLFFWASGNDLYEYESKVGSFIPNFWAALWVHEVLHSTGLSLHAPGNGFETGVGQNQKWKILGVRFLGNVQIRVVFGRSNLLCTY